MLDSSLRFLPCIPSSPLQQAFIPRCPHGTRLTYQLPPVQIEGASWTLPPSLMQAAGQSKLPGSGERETADGRERSSGASGSASALLFEYEGEEGEEEESPVVDFASRFVTINLYMPDAIPGIEAMALPPMMLGQVGGWVGGRQLVSKPCAPLVRSAS